MGKAEKVTFCRICEASCGLIAELDGDQVVKLKPDPEHVVSRGFACIKGVRYTELHSSPDRLLTPMKRVGDRFEPLSWEQALAEIGAKVRELREQHGADSTGLYVGNPAAFSPVHMVFAASFTAGMGTRHLYTSGSQDCNNKLVVAEEMFGSPLLQPIPDIDHAQCVIMVGTNPAVSQLSFANVPRVVERLKTVAKRPGGRVVFVNPRRTESAQQVGEHLPIRPGSDVYFFLAFAQHLLATRAPDPEIAAQVRGLEDLRELVRPWTPERVAELTGIAPHTLRRLVDDYCAAEGAVLYAGVGVNQSAHGTLAFWLLTTIQVLAGKLDRKGGALLTRQQIRTAALGYAKNDSIRHHTSRLSEHRSVLDSMPAGLLADEILMPGPGQLRALFVTAGNPVLSCPNSKRLRDALSQLPLLVCIDLFRNETGNLAHYLLPATSFLERADFPMGMSGYQPVPYAQYVEPVVPRTGEARDEWWIFAQLGRACGIPLNGSGLAQTWFNLSTCEGSWLPRFLRFTPKLIFLALLLLEFLLPRQLRKHPHGRLLRGHRPRIFLGKKVFTKDGKVQLAPKRFLAAAGALEQDFSEQMRTRSSLLLITKREKKSHNSWMHNAPSLGADARSQGNLLYVNPQNAALHGLREGELCEVRSSTGAVRLPVRISEEMMPNTVALPHGWGHAEAGGLTRARAAPGVNANLLSPDGAATLDPISGMSRLTALRVELKKVESATEG